MTLETVTYLLTQTLVFSTLVGVTIAMLLLWIGRGKV